MPQRGTCSENHGALTKNDLVLAAVADMLKTGDTRRLRTTAPKAADSVSRAVTEDELRAIAVRKVQWDTLSLDSRRQILDPVLPRPLTHSSASNAADLTFLR